MVLPSRLPRHQVLGIIGCQVFEDEIAHVVYNDLEVTNVFVIDSDESKGIINKIRMLDPEKKVVRMAEEWLETATVPRERSIIIWMKPISLHQSPAKLREDVTSAIYRIRHICHSIMLFYGICGNAFRSIDEIAKRAKANVVILKDEKGYIVDDCICTMVGGTEEYLEQLRNSSLAFQFTPMWAANWRRFFNEFQILRNPDDMEQAQIIFENMGYDKVLKLETGLGNRKAFDDQIQEFSDKFSLKIEALECTLKVVDSSYKKARQLLGAR
jgi:hypothetical protein